MSSISILQHETSPFALTLKNIKTLNGLKFETLIYPYIQY